MDFAELAGLVHFMFRWGHVVAGILWIGLLYYFNFVQGGYLAAATNEAKVEFVGKLLPNALLWFQWGALGTFLTGIALLMFLKANVSVGILAGALMGTLMFINVWTIIAPNQQAVIGAHQGAGDGAVADVSEQAAKALLASRTNTLFSLPMLYFMVAHMHGAGAAGAVYVNGWSDLGGAGMWTALLIIMAIEINALCGKVGPLATVKGVIAGGILLTLVLGGLVALL